MPIPKIPFKTLASAVSDNVQASIFQLLQQPGIDGVILVENKDLLSPAFGQRAIFAFGPSIKGREDIDHVDTNNKSEEPIGFCLRGDILEDLARDTCDAIQKVTKNKMSPPHSVLARIRELIDENAQRQQNLNPTTP